MSIEAPQDDKHESPHRPSPWVGLTALAIICVTIIIMTIILKA